MDKYVLKYDCEFLTTDPLASYNSFCKEILSYKNLIRGYEKYLNHLKRVFFGRKFLIMFPKLK